MNPAAFRELDYGGVEEEYKGLLQIIRGDEEDPSQNFNSSNNTSSSSESKMSPSRSSEGKDSGSKSSNTSSSIPSFVLNVQLSRGVEITQTDCSSFFYDLKLMDQSETNTSGIHPDDHVFISPFVMNGTCSFAISYPIQLFVTSTLTSSSSFNSSIENIHVSISPSCPFISVYPSSVSLGSMENSQQQHSRSVTPISVPITFLAKSNSPPPTSSKVSIVVTGQAVSQLSGQSKLISSRIECDVPLSLFCTIRLIFNFGSLYLILSHFQ